MFGLLALLLLFSFGVAHFARQRYESALARGRRFMIPGGDTAGEVVQEFLDSRGAPDVHIIERNALASDAFNPAKRTLSLNRSVMKGTDAGALAVALHEAAHALQGAASAAALKYRMSTIRLTRYGPTLIALAMVVLKFLTRMPIRGPLMVVLFSWSAIMIMNVLSLPIEFNASQRALAFLETKFEKHSRFVETMTTLLRGVAFRDTAAFLRSPLYCFRLLMRRRDALRPVE